MTIPQSQVAKHRLLEPWQQRKLEEACSYVQEHYQEPLSGEIIACAVGMSRAWLYQYFPRYAHQSVKAYLEQIRIKHALELLLSSDMLVKQITRASGFQSARTLRRTFIRKFGHPPQVIREHPQLVEELTS